MVMKQRLSGEMTEWPKVHDWKSCVGASRPRVRIPLSPPKKTGTYGSQATPKRQGVAGRVCTSVCTPPSIEEIERRIVEAELAGRRTVADALACRLDALRARDSVAIVDLSEERRRVVHVERSGPPRLAAEAIEPESATSRAQVVEVERVAAHILVGGHVPEGHDDTFDLGEPAFGRNKLLPRLQEAVPRLTSKGRISVVSDEPEEDFDLLVVPRRSAADADLSKSP